MPEPNMPLTHSDHARKDDTTLQREAHEHVARSPALQLVAELLSTLRGAKLRWWTPEGMRARWGAGARMHWLRERPDVRQTVTTQLTGFHANAARTRPPEFQAAMIDAVIDEGDITPEIFEGAFTPLELVTYGPVAEFWHEFRQRMPWHEDSPRHQEIVCWLITALLADESSFQGLTRRPILTPLDVRGAIDGRVWQTHVPADLRAAVDAARLEHERARPTQPFHARDELAIVTPERIAKHIPLRHLVPILDAAEHVMGFREPTSKEAPREAAAAATAVAMAAAAAAAEPPTDDEQPADSGEQPEWDLDEGDVPLSDGAVTSMRGPDSDPTASTLRRSEVPAADDADDGVPRRPSARPPARTAVAMYAPAKRSTPPPLPAQGPAPSAAGKK